MPHLILHNPVNPIKNSRAQSLCAFVALCLCVKNRRTARFRQIFRSQACGLWYNGDVFLRCRRAEVEPSAGRWSAADKGAYACRRQVGLSR